MDGALGITAKADSWLLPTHPHTQTHTETDVHIDTHSIPRLDCCAETQVLSAIIPLPYFSLAPWSLAFLFEFLFLVLGLDPRSCLKTLCSLFAHHSLERDLLPFTIGLFTVVCSANDFVCDPLNIHEHFVQLGVVVPQSRKRQRQSDL